MTKEDSEIFLKETCVHLGLSRLRDYKDSSGNALFTIFKQ
jgi:hypothetical protein